MTSRNPKHASSVHVTMSAEERDQVKAAARQAQLPVNSYILFRLGLTVHRRKGNMRVTVPTELAEVIRERAGANGTNPTAFAKRLLRDGLDK
ncbi:MAG: hypothetical protein OXH15_12485 [Gammaproteobacteria bacterium]|nr:hypothetical protein [Gammaproteobacteria bacterium]